uniref:Uncharacterized protein n=1 Tax=Micrurus spixii TaxID=129469 RepID=A0A2D4M7K1_9SAUR
MLASGNDSILFRIFTSLLFDILTFCLVQMSINISFFLLPHFVTLFTLLKVPGNSLLVLSYVPLFPELCWEGFSTFVPCPRSSNLVSIHGKEVNQETVNSSPASGIKELGDLGSVPLSQPLYCNVLSYYNVHIITWQINQFRFKFLPNTEGNFIILQISSV